MVRLLLFNVINFIMKNGRMIMWADLGLIVLVLLLLLH